MPKPERPRDLRREKGDASRLALRTAAITSVARHGLAGTTLTTVATLAGVSRALVGFHFKSKDQLLLEALETSLAIYNESHAQAVASVADTPRAKLEATILHDLRFVLSHPDLLSLWSGVLAEARGIELYRTIVLPHNRAVRDRTAGLITEIVGDTEVAHRHANILQAFIFGIWLDFHLGPDRFDIAAAEDAARELLAFGRK